jgi:hypothetical protein
MLAPVCDFPRVLDCYDDNPTLIDLATRDCLACLARVQVLIYVLGDNFLGLLCPVFVSSHWVSVIRDSHDQKTRGLVDFVGKGADVITVLLLPRLL